jgi:hypothetical protein
VVRKVYSHTRIRAKNELLIEIIRRLNINLIYTLQPVLKKVANLFNVETEPLALFVRKTLNRMHQPTDYLQVCTDLSKRSLGHSLQEVRFELDSKKLANFFSSSKSAQTMTVSII